jgi:hypothetical protein
MKFNDSPSREICLAGVPTMARVLAALFGIAFLMGISSCSVREHFEGQPVPRSIEEPLLGLSVAVFSDRSLRFEYPPIYSWSAFEEVMNPGLAETLRNGLDAAFHQVSMVENERAAAEMDLFAMPAIEVSDPLTLTATFREPCSGRDITRLSSSSSLDGHAFGMYSHLGTDFMLFATAVIMPLWTRCSRMRFENTARRDLMRCSLRP